MDGFKFGLMTSVNKALLKTGATSGFDNVVMGAGVGAGAGAIQGSFSDYEGVFGGAMKGAVVGGVAMTGAKFLGSRYGAGYHSYHGAFDPTANHTKEKLAERFGFNSEFLTDNKLQPGDSWFNGKFGSYDDLRNAAQHYNDNFV